MIPSIKRFIPADNFIKVSRFQKVFSSGLTPYLQKLLSTLISDISVFSENNDFYCLLSDRKDSVPKQEPDPGFDSYVIQIKPEGIRIDANSFGGLFYGIQTLMQLPDDLQCGTIQDSAAIKYRMIHWDLKGYQPKLSVLLEEMEILARHKINAILLEIEDKYQFRSAPGFAYPGAYTFEEMRQISRRASELNLMIVPVLQSIAHVDYILKHKQYSHLRENGHCFQFCSSNPEVDEFWNRMADELMDCFAEHPQYFHIGADEARYLGSCPECSRIGKAGSYIRRVEKSIDHVLKKGRTPVIWDDILRNSEKKMTEEEARECWQLGRKAVVMYWSYGRNGENNVFPFVRRYLDAGINVWASGCCSGADNWAGSIPPMEYRSANVAAWAKTAVENHLECECATAWTKILSGDCPCEPQECCWYSILYAADALWTGSPKGFRKFIYEASSQFYHEIPDEHLIESILNIQKSPYILEYLDKGDAQNHRLRFLQLAAAVESLSLIAREVFCWNQFYPGKIGYRLEDYRVDEIKKMVSLRKQQVADLKMRIKDSLNEFYTEQTVREFLDTRFQFLETFIDETNRKISVTESI